MSAEKANSSTPAEKGAGLVARLDRWLKKNRPGYYATLLPGVKPEILKKYERASGYSFPPLFREFYLWRNGEDIMAGVEERFYENWSLESTFPDPGPDMEPGGHNEELDYWNKDWHAFAGDGGGDFLILDMAGSHGGKPGQIIDYWHEDNESGILFPSFDCFLESFVETLEADCWEVQEDGIFTVRKKALTTYRKIDKDVKKRHGGKK